MPDQSGFSGLDGAWLRAFQHGRMAGLGASFAATPFLLVRPDIASQALPVLAATLAVSLAGLAAAHDRRTACVAAMIALPGYLMLGIGLGSGLTVATAVIAGLAMALDVIMLPTRRGGAPAMVSAGLAAALLALVLLAPAAGAVQVALSALLLPLAPLVTVAMQVASLKREARVATDRAERIARRDESLLAATHAAVVIVERGGHVIDATGHAGQLLAAPLAELAGRGFVERVLIADRPAFLSAVADAAGERRGTQLTLRLACGPSTSTKGHGLFLLSVEPSAGATGTASIRVSAVASHATRPVAERAVLFQTLSHEVRTPMNAILGFSEMLANPALQPREPKKIAEYATLIQTSARGSFAVMRALVDLLRVEATEFDAIEPVDIVEMARATLLQLQGREPDGTITIAMTGEAGALDADPRAVRMLFSAVLEGLTAAMASPSQIDCAFSQRASGPEVEIALRPRQDAAQALHREAFLGVVQELAHRLAAACHAELVLEPAGGGWNVSVSFAAAPASLAPTLVQPRGHAAPVCSPSVVPFRKSA